MLLSRRHLLAAGAAACALSATPASARAWVTADIPERYHPRRVAVSPTLQAGVIHVVPEEYALYWIEPGGFAMRYIVGIGRPGLYEPGSYFIGAKKEWPSWKPTDEMVERSPELYAQYAEDGMEGGLANPLGARALYLFQPRRGDTFLRIHGTNAPGTLGRAVSNGCARLLNDQIEDLYARVPLRTPVILHPKDAI